MAWFACPYLQSEVDLADEREQHIIQRHPDLLPAYRERMVETLASPDQVRRSKRFGNARLFSRWFDTVRGEKYVVVIVVSDPAPSNRHSIITAYLARRVEEGVIEWTRS